MRILYHQNRGYRDVDQRITDINVTSDCEQEDLAKAAELIESARAGGPSGLVQLGSASDAADRPIEVYDELGKLMYVVGDAKDGIPIKVEYHEPKGRDGIGHYTLPGGNEPTTRSARNNMCLYNVLAEQTGLDPNTLKDSILNIMANNIKTFSKQMSDIAHLEMYSRMKLALGGAVFNAKNPDEAADYLLKSNGRYGFRNTNKGHPSHHIPYRRSTQHLLESTSEHLNMKIEVYNDKSELLYSVGENIKGTPVKLEHHKPEGDTSGEYFSSVGGTEAYRLNDPRSPKSDDDMDFWKVVGKLTEQDAKTLKSEVTKKMDAQIIPAKTYCVEEASLDKGKRKGRKSGYISKDEAAFVTYYAMQTEAVKRSLDKLNQYEAGVKTSDEYVFAEITLSAEDLHMPRTAYGADWRNGKIVHVWPITGPIEMKLQHYKHQENNRTADVQFQTNFPRPPPVDQYLPDSDIVK